MQTSDPSSSSSPRSTQTHKHTYRQTDRLMTLLLHRALDLLRHTNTHTDRQTDRQTDRLMTLLLHLFLHLETNTQINHERVCQSWYTVITCSVHVSLCELSTNNAAWMHLCSKRVPNDGDVDASPKWHFSAMLWRSASRHCDSDTEASLNTLRYVSTRLAVDSQITFANYFTVNSAICFFVSICRLSNFVWTCLCCLSACLSVLLSVCF